MSDLRIKPWLVAVHGFGAYTYFAPSRGRALADAWRSSAFLGWSFKDFLRSATACLSYPAHGRFGEEITVGGQPAYLIDFNRQYISFARPGGTTVLCSHPLDVEPPEARRGTPYFEDASKFHPTEDAGTAQQAPAEISTVEAAHA